MTHFKLSKCLTRHIIAFVLSLKINFNVIHSEQQQLQQNPETELRSTC